MLPFDRRRNVRNLHLPSGLYGVSSISVLVDINRLYACGLLVRINQHISTALQSNFRHSSFLQFVSDRASFDAQLESYVQTTYVQDKLVHYALLLPYCLAS